MTMSIEKRRCRVIEVCNVEPAIRTHRHPSGKIELRLGGWAAVATESIAPISGHSSHDPVRPHAADAVVVEIRDVEATVRAHGDPKGAIELRLGGWTAVTAEAIDAIPGDGRDDAVRPYTADAVVTGIGDVETAIWAHRHIAWTPELCLGSYTKRG